MAANEPAILPGPTDSSKDNSNTAATDRLETENRADKRYDEMLGKMRDAVQEIAQLYGNPTFLQIFTNDMGKASELKEMLKAARGSEEIKREIQDLEKKRDELMNDIALKERETAKLSERLVRQRAALDSVAAAVDQAKTAVEGTAR
jgi:hypothetical protein